MGKRRVRHTVALFAFIAILAGTLEPAEALPFPSISLTGTDDHQTFVRRRRSQPVFVDLGAWIRSEGGAFEIRASRDENYGPISLRQVDADNPNTAYRTLDPALMNPRTWDGFIDFFELDVTRTSTNGLVSHQTLDWCPNSFETERRGDSGPISPRYPQTCSGMEFTRGAVWGIDADWATNPLAFVGTYISVPDGTYDVTLKIAPDYAAAFDIAPGDDVTHTSFSVRTRRRRRRRAASSTQRAQTTHEEAAFVSPPDDDTPEQAWLPDLQALPARSISMDNSGTTNVLNFAATEWNAGPQPMVIEGFRDDTSDPSMTAYQYFYENGEPVARDQVAELEYDADDGHNHWHFQEFVKYELIDEFDVVRATSGKEAWCLVPTDPVDLTVPGAEWRPGNTDLGSACGNERSLWVREVLDAGHGDTYFQVAGQAFDVTQLEEGNYRIRITVNPLGQFHETSPANNVSLRDVEIVGSGDNRTVIVPPYHGIDA